MTTDLTTGHGSGQYRLPEPIAKVTVSNPRTWLRVGVVGTVLVVLCCFTPVLVILLGVLGWSALTGYLDVVLLPALALFIGLTVYALWRKRQADSRGAKARRGARS